ncbi:MAG: 30S ribosomal protein S21, partial [Thermodesulfobacteriota bacterium]|nr:30S ribosomal protein S21 [Thermodesulfobacteriota bacterium]
NNENLENALRRFKRQVEKGGVLSDAKKKEYFEKPSETKKKKLFAAKKRINKKKRISK